MKIGILGVGGVGSLIASRLSETKHKTFCLGSLNSNKHIRKNGISIKSNFYGDKNFFSEDINQKVKLDFLFITVKGTKLEESLENYRDFLKKNTVVISLLNGLDYREIIRNKFNLNLIMGSIGSLEVFLDSNRVAIHKSNKKPTVNIATSESKLKSNIIFINNLLIEIGFNSKIKDNEDSVIWEKLTRLTVISTITSIQDSTIGFALEKSPTKEMIMKLINELCLITSRINQKSDPDEIYKTIKALPYDLKTSMQRDIHINKPSEIDFILKAPLEFGNKLGLELPVMKYCYEILCKKINQKL